MKKYRLLMLFSWMFVGINAQTVVRMSFPEQSKEQMQVVVLFDEPVPEGIPVVLGLMGYNVVGGIEPYTFEWVQNNKVIGTGDVVVIVPAKGDQLSLKATDKNKCYSTSSFSMKVIGRVASNEKHDNYIKIYPTIVTDGLIHIELNNPDNLLHANIRVFDIEGKLLYQTKASENFILNEHFPTGTYFISVKTSEYHKVERVIIQ